MAVSLAAAITGASTALVPASAAAAGLEVSVGDRLGDTTTLAAGRPVQLVASVFLDHSDSGCETKDLTSITATLSLPGGVALRSGAPASQTVPVPAAATAPATLNVRWPVRIARLGSYAGHLVVTARSRDGRSCSATQNLTIVAVARVSLRVAGALLFPDHVMIAVEASMPTTHPPSGDAYTDALNQQHDPRGQNFGLGLLDLVTLSRDGHTLDITNGSEFSGGRTGVACLDFVRPRGLRHGTVSYRVRFTWNREKGFAPVLAHGHVSVATRPANRSERRCLSQEGIATGQSPVGGR